MEQIIVQLQHLCEASPHASSINEICMSEFNPCVLQVPLASIANLLTLLLKYMQCEAHHSSIQVFNTNLILLVQPTYSGLSSHRRAQSTKVSKVQRRVQYRSQPASYYSGYVHTRGTFLLQLQCRALCNCAVCALTYDVTRGTTSSNAEWPHLLRCFQL